MFLMLLKRLKINEWFVSLYYLFLLENKNKSYWEKRKKLEFWKIFMVYLFLVGIVIFFFLVFLSMSCLIRGLVSRLKKCNKVLCSSKYF